MKKKVLKMCGMTVFFLVFVIVLVFLILLLLQSISVEVKKPLDEIRREAIWIDVQEDGSMYIIYEIDWKVLDSTSEGPLSWVKIGIPNKYVEEAKPLSDNIKKLGYYGSGGDYIRVDLDREYEAGETVNMKFSIHQHRMYEEASGNYKYRFTPGWFDDIAVKELQIFWSGGESIESDMTFFNKEGGYLETWKNLEPGERVSVTVTYPKDAYKFDDDYDKGTVPVGRMIVTVLAAAFGVLGLIIYAVRLYAGRNREGIKDSYEKNRGLGSVYVQTGRGRGMAGRSGGGCACACACACAGGGRAGCSRKDFFYRCLSRTLHLQQDSRECEE